MIDCQVVHLLSFFQSQPFHGIPTEEYPEEQTAGERPRPQASDRFNPRQFLLELLKECPPAIVESLGSSRDLPLTESVSQ